MRELPATLPIVQSIPHGGLATPREFADQLALSATAVYNEADLWADALYDFTLADAPVNTLATVRAAVARGIVDVNRPPDDFDNPDGAVKVVSSYGEEVFSPALTALQKTTLVQRYWQPWHAALETALRTSAGECRLLLDCHTMAQTGPTTYAFAGAARPFICLANLGDASGEPRSDGSFAGSTTTPAWFLQACGEIARQLFGDLRLLEPDHEQPPVVALNWPFAGGYISRRYTAQAEAGHPVADGVAPWSLMVEINRGLYVGNQNASTPIAPPNEDRIAAVRDRLALWAKAICDLLPADPT